ncbi:hypothetical protein BBJ28_00003087 [Nothophytophthora sp. Chile5]|nr:hypothetical protein BBJ28_00003087 [Nothophytophthora sp. Chile5]
MEGLNKAFFEFIVGQARENPRSNWSAAVQVRIQAFGCIDVYDHVLISSCATLGQDYVKHADEIAIKHASTKPLSLFEQAQFVSPIYSYEAMSRPSAAGFSGGFGLASIRSGGIGDASSSVSQPTAPGYAFAPVSATQAPKRDGVIAGPGSDYNLFRDFGGERSSTLFNPPETAFN